ncbi:MAG: right-handed parallel beta-helix repeat-containing protein [Planctomycetota bacterium]|jgi:parallel beta-helix repeat protein
MKTTKLLASIVVIVGVLALSSANNAGNLEPSAAPAPTMKTLDEVEARIPIPGSSSPIGTFVISSAGSYYLTADRYANDDGIRVDVDNVTIDLNGYNLIGSAINNGVYMRMKNNVEIRNGTVRNFDRGIYESDTSGKNHRIINVRAASNDLDGIHLKGSNHLVKDCTVSGNGTSASIDVYGIYVGIGSTVTGNTTHNNGTSASATVIGIYACGSGCTVTGNTSHNNGGNGIDTYPGCTITGNTCYSNGDNGLSASSGCAVTGNTCYNNDGKGFSTGVSCTVTGNTCYNNGSDGIYVGLGSTVTGNTASENTNYGIKTFSYCLIDQNTAHNNGTNMSTGTGCVLGVNCAPP